MGGGWAGPLLFIAPIYLYAFCGFAIMPMGNALLTQPFPHGTSLRPRDDTLWGILDSSAVV